MQLLDSLAEIDATLDPPGLTAAKQSPIGPPRGA